MRAHPHFLFRRRQSHPNNVRLQSGNTGKPPPVFAEAHGLEWRVVRPDHVEITESGYDDVSEISHDRFIAAVKKMLELEILLLRKKHFHQLGSVDPSNASIAQ